MHEFGIVQTWLAAAREAARGRPLAALRVRVGALSGVEPDALAFAFEAAAPDARLDVETVPATRQCDACSAVFPFPGNGPACPACGSSRATWRSGFEIELVSATLAEPLSSRPSNPPPQEPNHV